MIIESMSPARISLAGGGTDIGEYASKYGGLVLSMAINIRASVQLLTDDDAWAQASHLLPFDADPTLTYLILDRYGLNGMHAPVRVKSKFDGIIGAGLGSSAAYAVALIAALRKYKGLPIVLDDIANEAYEIEVNELNWYGGKQDQYASVYGGFNLIFIDRKVTAQSTNPDLIKNLLPYLVLVYAGGQRNSYKIQSQNKELTPERVKHLDTTKLMVEEMISILELNQYNKIGLLLDKAWQLKKQASPGATNEKIDRIYAKAIELGAEGGKILGAGGAGYMLFFVRPEKRKGFLENMNKEGIEEVDFDLDENGLEVRRL